MAIKRYLAMTAAEFGAAPSLPPEIAWMACHFSPYGTGLSNLPYHLPAGSLLILNDFIPIHRHDPSVVGAQLRQCVDRFSCSGILLDFQRCPEPGIPELTEFLVRALPCPVAVSENYCAGLDCPVFLPPLPHHIPLGEYLAPWQGREVWLDLTADAEQLRVTREGSRCSPLAPEEHPANGHSDQALHCHYTIQTAPEEICFTLWRTAGDLQALTAEAEAAGVRVTVGLYQELHDLQFSCPAESPAQPAL